MTKKKLSRRELVLAAVAALAAVRLPQILGQDPLNLPRITEKSLVKMPMSSTLSFPVSTATNAVSAVGVTRWPKELLGHPVFMGDVEMLDLRLNEMRMDMAAAAAEEEDRLWSQMDGTDPDLDLDPPAGRGCEPVDLGRRDGRLWPQDYYARNKDEGGDV